MLEFQILDVDYIMLNDRPVVRIFGKTAEGETVCAFYEGYMPYFYAAGRGVLELLKNEPLVVRTENAKRRFVFDHNEVRDVIKVTLKNPAKTPELREKLKMNGVKPYEADILFKYRFMNDVGLSGLGWVGVAENNISTNTVKAGKIIKADKLVPVKSDKDAPLKYLALDIECTPITPGGVPEARKDPIIMISLVFNQEYKGKKSIVLSTRRDQYVAAFGDEKAMLEELIRIINDYDPDVITGYNINSFDFPYILERMKQNNVRPVFGRCNQKYVVARKVGMRYRVSITGRIMVDSFEIVKKDFSLQRYGLDFVAETLLKQKKDDVKHSEIDKLWRGDQEGFRKLISYSRKDSVLAMDLVLKLNLVDKYIALSKVSGTLLQDTLDSGETARIENFLLREFNKEGYVFPCKPDASEIGKREKERVVGLKGGFVLEPEKKLHSNVAVLDFRSMYPSIIQTFNICPTTIVRNESPVDVIKTPSGAMFLPKETRTGIIPKIVEGLMKSRRNAKRRLNKCTDPAKKRALDAEQWALKIMANAFYGHFGYSRARVYDLDIANAITTCGRDIIKKTADRIEKDFGYRVIYGDTDSVFVKMPEDDKERIYSIANDISAKITKQLPGIMELEFEKVFKRFLPLTKKRYVAWKFVPVEKEGKVEWEEGIEMKGIETVRRDWCGLVSDTMKEVIEMILKRDDAKGAVNYFRHVVEALVRGVIPIQKLVIRKTMTKSPGSYVGIQPHIELVKKIQARNPAEAPGIGDRIGYVIVKGTQLLSKRAEDPIYIVEKGLQIDSNYYIDNQLLPPLERIFRGLGVSKPELLGNGKQIGILDALKNHRAPEAKPVKEVGIEQMNGFICSKCNRFYPRVPLVGTCGCGGNLLFSSSQGPVEWVVT